MMRDAIGQHVIKFELHGEIRREIKFEIKFVIHDAIKFAIGHDAIKFELLDTIKFILQPL